MWVKTQGGLLKTLHLAVCWGGVGSAVNNRTLINSELSVGCVCVCDSVTVPLVEHVYGPGSSSILSAAAHRLDVCGFIA